MDRVIELFEKGGKLVQKDLINRNRVSEAYSRERREMQRRLLKEKNQDRKAELKERFTELKRLFDNITINNTEELISNVNVPEC